MRDDFTPTQLALLKVLSDGLRHTKKELVAYLQDDLSSPKAVSAHICNMRKVLQPRGEDIVCEIDRYRTYYRHVRLLPSATNGYH